MRAHPAGPRHGEILAPPGAPTRPVSPAEALVLDPTIWSQTAKRNDAGALTVGAVDVRDLAQDFGTPLFVLDEVDFRTRARAFHDAFNAAEPKSEVYYAGKAFLTTTIARWLTDEGLVIDVCTGGELACALRAGVPAESLLFHGNNKSVAEIERGVNAGVSLFVVDSFDEIDRIAAAATAAGRVQGVLVRVTTGVEAHTHEFIATAHEDQKFGFSLSSGIADEAVKRVLAHDSLKLVGLHSHIGSQIFDLAGFEVAAHRVAEFAAAIKHDHGVEVELLDLGGGMGIAYVDGDDPIGVDAMAQQLRGIVTRVCAEEGLPVPRLAIEPGRAIVGPSGLTLYEVGTVKEVDLGGGHWRTYVSVDGGMSDNIRTALYDAEYTVTVANRASDAEPVLSRIVGKHCESGDIVVRDCWLPADLRPGDLLAVAATGAYCRAMASQYNYVPRPGVVGVKGGMSSVILRRETEDDLFATDPGA
jgi:diaminopimelate decarboxylase